MMQMSKGEQLWQTVIGHVEAGRWDEMLEAAKALHALETGARWPKPGSLGVTPEPEPDTCKECGHDHYDTEDCEDPNGNCGRISCCAFRD